MKQNLLQKIQDKSIVAGVVGLGYVGLPLAVEKAKAGFRTIGFDVQKDKVDMVNAGHNYIGDVVDSDLASLVAQGRLSATTDFSFTHPSWKRPTRRSSPGMSSTASPCSASPVT